MKRIALVFFATSLLFACNDDKKGSQTKNKENSNAQDSAKNDDANGDKDTKTNPSDFADKDKEKTWSSYEEKLFLSSCITAAEKKASRTAATQYCECMLDRVRAEYPDYDEANTKLADDREKMEEIAKKCNPSNGQ